MFFVDTNADSSLPRLNGSSSRESLGIKGKLFSADYEREKKSSAKKSDSVEEFCGLMGWTPKLLDGKSTKPTSDLLKLTTDKEIKTNFDTLSVERQYSLKPISVRQKKKMNKELRDKSKGKDWFGLPATEVTDEIKNDLQVLQMRSALDPKHFYKKNDLKVLPKYFQIGKYESSPLDYHNEKNVKQSKKKSIVEELLQDAEFQKRIKQKYKESIIQQKPKFWGRNSRNKNKDDKKNNKKKRK